jgi:hypothetical protein
MELPNNIYLDDLIIKIFFSYLPITKFKKGVYTSPMLFMIMKFSNTQKKHMKKIY